jgi:hypothetical protein
VGSSLGIIKKRIPIVKPLLQFSIILSLVFVISLLGYSTIISVDQDLTSPRRLDKENNLYLQIFRPNEQVSPTVTIYINLPIIEQDAQTTPEPIATDPEPVTEIEAETGTPTPTPIPVQTGSVNLPIVIGALAIIVVIILAWFFIGFLPNRNRE